MYTRQIATGIGKMMTYRFWVSYFQTKPWRSSVANPSRVGGVRVHHGLVFQEILTGSLCCHQNKVVNQVGGSTKKRDDEYRKNMTKSDCFLARLLYLKKMPLIFFRNQKEDASKSNPIRLIVVPKTSLFSASASLEGYDNLEMAVKIHMKAFSEIAFVICSRIWQGFPPTRTWKRWTVMI